MTASPTPRTSTTPPTPPAEYLCTAAGDLSTDAGIHRGIYAYNHSDAYVSKVLGFAQEYIHLLT